MLWKTGALLIVKNGLTVLVPESNCRQHAVWCWENWMSTKVIGQEHAK